MNTIGISVAVLMAAVSPSAIVEKVDECAGKIFNLEVYIDIAFSDEVPVTDTGDCNITLLYRMPPMNEGAPIFTVQTILKNGSEVTTGVQITKTTLVCVNGKMKQKEEDSMPFGKAVVTALLTMLSFVLIIQWPEGIDALRWLSRQSAELVYALLRITPASIDHFYNEGGTTAGVMMFLFLFLCGVSALIGRYRR